ncbi:MAG TPA: glycosyltransferase family 2 protein [Jatrophihabitans sp.]|nr:glycosyltransferase family 2 protein [Jatrophihabitans sp.]
MILPCLDEAEALPWVLGRIPAGVRAIVVDNGSADGSPQLAAELGATVVSCDRRGYGAACHAGLEAATAELVAFCDCDSSIDPAPVLDFAAPVLADQADLVIGRRRPRGRGAWPAHARIANAVLAHRIRRSTGIQLHDIGPLRVGRRSQLLGLGQLDRRSGYPLETVLLAAKAGLRIVEADVDYHARAGRSKVTGTVRGTAQAIRDMSAVLAR